MKVSVDTRDAGDKDILSISNLHLTTNNKLNRYCGTFVCESHVKGLRRFFSHASTWNSVLCVRKTRNVMRSAFFGGCITNSQTLKFHVCSRQAVHEAKDELD